MSVHSFDTDVAAMVGTTAATIAYNIQHWCEKNAANGMHEHDGRHWTYNSVSAFKDLFPYLSPKQIRTALDKLEDAGLVLSGCFNKQGRDQTKWYSFVPEAVVKTANCPKGQVQLPKRANPFAQKGRPLPDSKPDNKPTTNVVVGAQSADTQPEQPKQTAELFEIKPKAKGKKRGPARQTQIPKDWQPSVSDIAYAAKHELSPEDIENEASRFYRHFKAKGTRWKDWHLVWCNWLTGDYGIVTKRRAAKANAASGGFNPRAKAKYGGGGFAATALRVAAEARGYGQQVS